jgi:hypothetical protein
MPKTMSISTSVLKSLSELGFTLSPKPGYDIPILPLDITELDDEALMELFVKFTQWNDHLSGARAIAAINEREAERALNVAEANAMLQNWTGAKGGDRITIIKAHIATSPIVAELHDDYNTKYAFRKLIETRAENVERDSQLVSRELTRRTSDMGGMRSRTRKFTT